MSTGERQADRNPAAEQDEQFVAAWLETHPEFFERHPQILEQLYLSHPSGSAVSLVEKQLSILRERNTELRNRLTALLEDSRRNDELFGHTRQLVLRLVAADSLESLCQALHEGLARDFGLKHFRLLFLDRAIEYPALNVGHADSGEAETQLPALQGRNRTFCGILRPGELDFLFGDTGRDLGSAAVVRLPGDPSPALLALAHPDPDHYHRDMDTLFLNHIAEVLARLLEQRL